MQHKEHAHDHGHDHGHDHDHDHDPDVLRATEPSPEELPRIRPAQDGFTPGEAKQANRLGVIVVIIALFFVVEYAGAVASRSNALEADAIHLLMDVAALGMSLVAMRIAVRKPTVRFTFGMRRAEPIVAIFNAALVLAAVIQIVRNGVNELRHGSVPEAGIMLVVAAAALVVNGLSAWLLHGALHHGHDHADHDHDHDHAPGDHDHDGAAPKKQSGHALNLRGAWLHLVGDVLGSLAALGAAIVIHYGGPPQVDPIASFLVAIILILGAVRLVRDASLVLLEAAPAHLRVGAVREAILAFPGVAEVHELHVWTLGGGHDAISAHVLAVSDEAAFGARLSANLRESFGAEYVTVQVEARHEDCQGRPK